MPLHATEDRARTFRNLSGGARTFYVRPGGEDFINDGMSPAAAFKTIQRALFEMEKDFWNGYYVVDVTGCTIDEEIIFPQIRSGGHVYGPRNEDGLTHANDSYGAAFRSAVNFRANPQVLYTGPATDLGLLNNAAGEWTQLQVSGAAWQPGEHKKHFLKGTNGDLIPIWDNTADTLFICPTVVERVDLEAANITLVALGATFLGRRTGQYILDSLLGGYTFFGIHFYIDATSTEDRDEWMKITNCPSLVFEGCLFDGSDWQARIRTGGSGLLRFMRCRAIQVPLRHVGGSYLLYDNIWDSESGSYGLFSSGSIDNYDDQTLPVPSMLTMAGGMYQPGWFDSNRYGLHIWCNRVVWSTPDGTFLWEMGNVKGTFSYCKFRLPTVSVMRGTSVLFEQCEMSDLEVKPGGFAEAVGMGGNTGNVTVSDFAPTVWGDLAASPELSDADRGAVLVLNS